MFPKHHDTNSPASDGGLPWPSTSEELSGPRSASMGRRVLATSALLLAVGLLPACTSGSEPGGAQTAADAAADAGDEAPAEGGEGPAAEEDHGDHAQHESKVPVGPIELPAAEWWSVLQPSDGVTQVRAGGCPEDQACPNFEILSGTAAEGIDPAAAHVADGATCPGPDGLTASALELVSETDVEVAGTPTKLSRFRLACLDAAGTQVGEVEQMQWYVADAPSGPVVVIDRWAFEGLEDRLAAGAWPAA